MYSLTIMIEEIVSYPFFTKTAGFLNTKDRALIAQHRTAMNKAKAYHSEMIPQSEDDPDGIKVPRLKWPDVMPVFPVTSSQKLNSLTSLLSDKAGNIPSGGKSGDKRDKPR
jgi:hypothetical protein